MSRFFISRPIFAAVISIVITLAGLIASQVLPVAQYPEIAPPTVTITATYPGASAETLAAAVNSGSFAVADSKRFRPVGAVQVPGRGEPVEVFIVPAFEAGGR